MTTLSFKFRPGVGGEFIIGCHKLFQSCDAVIVVLFSRVLKN